MRTGPQELLQLSLKASRAKWHLDEDVWEKQSPTSLKAVGLPQLAHLPIPSWTKMVWTQTQLLPSFCNNMSTSRWHRNMAISICYDWLEDGFHSHKSHKFSSRNNFFKHFQFPILRCELSRGCLAPASHWRTVVMPYLAAGSSAGGPITTLENKGIISRLRTNR